MLREIIPDPDSRLEIFLEMSCYDDTYFGHDIEMYEWYAILPYVQILLESRENLNFPEVMKPPADLPERAIRGCTRNEQGKAEFVSKLLRSIKINQMNQKVDLARQHPVYQRNPELKRILEIRSPIPYGIAE